MLRLADDEPVPRRTNMSADLLQDKSLLGAHMF